MDLKNSWKRHLGFRSSAQTTASKKNLEEARKKRSAQDTSLWHDRKMPGGAYGVAGPKDKYVGKDFAPSKKVKAEFPRHAEKKYTRIMTNEKYMKKGVK